jgi:hypothetical protein
MARSLHAGIVHTPLAAVITDRRGGFAPGAAVVHDVGTRLQAGRLSAVGSVRVVITITLGEAGVVKARAIGEPVGEGVGAVPVIAENGAGEARTFVDPVQVLIQPVRVVVAESRYALAVSVTVIGRRHGR